MFLINIIIVIKYKLLHNILHRLIFIGGDKNVSRALALYDKAASKGSIRAFNGLGYVYFFGNGDEVPVNQVKFNIYLLLNFIGVRW